MIHIALYRPEIPPNTGNIARLCASAQVPLHIVGQAAFRMDESAVKRAGLDYWPWVNIAHHAGLDELKTHLSMAQPEQAMEAPRVLCFTTKASRSFTDFEFRRGDCLLFGPETSGLPPEILEAHAATCLTIPMKSPHVRSLNLANSVSIVAYEAFRQLDYFRS